MARRVPLHIVNRVVENLAQQERVISFSNRWVNAAEHLFQKLRHFFASGGFEQSLLLVRLCFLPLIVGVMAGLFLVAPSLFFHVPRPNRDSPNTVHSHHTNPSLTL